MVIYIEGVDGSGKSSFAAAVTTYLQEKGFKVHPKAEKQLVTHPWRLNRLTTQGYLSRLRSFLGSAEVFIVDRGELSDIIYRTFDNEKYSALMTLSEFYRFYQMMQHSFIVVHCDTDQSYELMLKRGEDNQVSITEHQKLRYLFNQVMPLFNAIKYDLSVKPSYLDAILANVRMQLILNGATDHEL